MTTEVLLGNGTRPVESTAVWTAACTRCLDGSRHTLSGRQHAHVMQAVV